MNDIIREIDLSPHTSDSNYCLCGDADTDIALSDN